jgi:hypothetical protein
VAAMAPTALAATAARDTVLVLPDRNSGASLKLAAEATEAKPVDKTIAAAIVEMNDFMINP